MRMTEAMIAFNPGGEIKVVGWPDREKRSAHLRWTVGACNLEFREASPAIQVALLFIEFQSAVVTYGIPAADAHREFLKIDEYRWHIAPDCQGTEEMPEEWEKTLRKPAVKRR